MSAHRRLGSTFMSRSDGADRLPLEPKSSKSSVGRSATSSRESPHSCQSTSSNHARLGQARDSDSVKRKRRQERMGIAAKCYVGIDVSSTVLDVAAVLSKERRSSESFPN